MSNSVPTGLLITAPLVAGCGAAGTTPRATNRVISYTTEFTPRTIPIRAPRGPGGTPTLELGFGRLNR